MSAPWGLPRSDGSYAVWGLPYPVRASAADPADMSAADDRPDLRAADVDAAHDQYMHPDDDEEYPR